MRLISPHLEVPKRGEGVPNLQELSLLSQAHSGAEGACASLLSAWLLLGNLLICILWQELSHWSSKLSRENPSTCETHAGSIRAPPAINQQEQCILGVGGNSYLKMVEVHWPNVKRWVPVHRLPGTQPCWICPMSG